MKIEDLIKILKKFAKESPGIEVKIGVPYEVRYSEYTSDTSIRPEDINSIIYQDYGKNAKKVKPFIEILT